MKITFDEINEYLRDPFFEIRHLGKDAIKLRTSPMEKYMESPNNLQFLEWTKEDYDEVIQYSFIDTAIGRLLIANTSKGICFLGFCGVNGTKIIDDFQARFPRQQFKEQTNGLQTLAADYCNVNNKEIIPLHLKGTDFQITIWKKLLRIPEGRLSTYGSLAEDPKSSQAVGSAVGANPVSYIIPCHRIVKGDGSFHGYHWGTEIKKQLLAYELQNCF